MRKHLLQSIIENPTDWLPRLAYADWLEENDQPGHEAIRLQHELLTTICQPDRQQLESRLRHLGPAPIPHLIVDLGGVDMVFAPIPAGTFLMGSPGSENNCYDDEEQHVVVLTRGFYLGIHAISQAQWQAVMGDNPSHFQGDDNRPVERVSWHMCQEFCVKATEKTGLPFRLPTEAEWEYSCRAGTTSPYYFGDELTQDLANFAANETVDVGKYKPNAFGLYQMHGNVWEWCQDWYGKYEVEYLREELANKSLRGGAFYLPESSARSACRFFIVPWKGDFPIGFRVAIDPQGGEDGDNKVLRGGSFNNQASYVRSAFRAFIVPSEAYRGYGFRVAIDPQGGEEGDSKVLRGGSFVNLVSYVRSAYRSLIVPTSLYINYGFRVAIDLQRGAHDEAA